MTIGYSIEVVGLDEQLAKYKQFDQIVNRELTTAMNQSVNALVSKIRPLTPVFTARLRQSIGSEVTQAGVGNIVGTVGSTLTTEIYPEVMEFGRKPGRMPPPSALERWVHLVMGVPNDEAPEVAFKVARAIGRHGIKGHFFMKRGWEASKDAIIRYFNSALERIAQGLSNGRR